MQTENTRASNSQRYTQPAIAAQDSTPAIIHFEESGDENDGDNREVIDINNDTTLTESNSDAFNTDVDVENAATPGPANNPPPPCYFWNVCAERAAMEKLGRAVCSKCSQNLNGFEYPLRAPSRTPLYISGHAAAEAMNLTD